MTLMVQTPKTLGSERDYILGVLLGNFLGLTWERAPGEGTGVRITQTGALGSILLPDNLFSIVDSQWLTPSSLPARPLAHWDTRDLSEDITLVKRTVPVIYGDKEPRIKRDGDCIKLPIDIFGSSFFMLSRYEELVTAERDEHDRFPASASLAFKEGFLERPIVDEYVEVLWTAMKTLWPSLKRRERRGQTRVSHDVDRPSRYSFGNFRQFVRSVGGDVLKRGDVAALWRGPRCRHGAYGRLHSLDPFNTFDWLMDVSEEHGITSAFYFIPSTTYGAYEPQYDIDAPIIRTLIKQIHSRGHEVGLHPGYNTYRNPRRLADQADRLRNVCVEEGVTQNIRGGRMHYLQWSMDITPYAWEQSGMVYDSTLGYADHAGFRCGTSHDFPLFDLEGRRELNVIERPLIAMDGTVLSEKYMGFTGLAGCNVYLNLLRERCYQFEGCFNLLWHNSSLDSRKKKEKYKNVIR